VHPTRNHFLPPDPDAFKQARPSHGRVIVIAPTRAACETIELALHLTSVDTVLEREHGAELREWAAAGQGFGIVAGTGTGKTLGIRPVAETILGESLRVGVVNREREATPETPTWNVVIVTTGIARRWFQDDLIGPRDTVVVDEIHQTSAELELCLALGKRAGVRFIWLSATVDPAFYAKYLGSANVLVTEAFDPALRARVKVEAKSAEEFFDERFMRHLLQQKRGVAVFVPTRREVEQLAADLGARYPRLNAAFYHGGEPIRVIRNFLEGDPQKPFLLAMTAAGQSAINVRGLDTVVIYDARYGNVVERGRNVLHRLYLGANEILQMAGRVHGRVANGEVYILSDRRMVFEELVPGPPEFQLAGDAERVAITCASIGVDAADLELPVPLDRTAYRRAMAVLIDRGIIKDGRLTPYGREVEAMPVERPWGELLVRADPELVPLVATAANIDSLHRMTREERELHGLVANGSDHLTAANVYAEAVNQHGYLGEVYGLPRHLFEDGLTEWAEKRGVLLKSVEDTALGVAAVYRALELPLPKTMPYASKELRNRFIELVARVMPFDLVIDERTLDGTEARISKTSMAGSWGAVAGTLRFFGDRNGIARAGIEGTTIPFDLVRQNARKGPPVVSVGGPRKHRHLAVSRRLTYFGFELETVVEELRGEVPAALQEQARDALADALLEGDTPHPDQGRIKRALTELGELWRRSGGTLEALATPLLRARIRERLAEVSSWQEFLGTRVTLDADSLVDGTTRARLLELPSMVHLLGDAVPLDYEVEDGAGVVVLRLREGQLRRMRPEDIPLVDRPLRYSVMRGAKPALHGKTLDELREAIRTEPRERKERHTEFRGPRGRGGRGSSGRGGGGGGGGRRGGRDGKRGR
jgi:ATP-dependent helicase HrpA